MLPLDLPSFAPSLGLFLSVLVGGALVSSAAGGRERRVTSNTRRAAPPFEVTETEDEIRIAGSAIEAAVRKRGYVSGVAGGSFLDKKSGFRDAGFGLDIVDWIMEPGSDQAYRDRLEGDLAYDFNNLVHGRRPKRCLEGPQICTRAREVASEVIRGERFVAVKTRFRYRIAAPGKKTGSLWEQTLVFPAGERYFLSSDRITAVNASEAMFLRIDMPGHIRHSRGDTFSEVYLGYRVDGWVGRRVVKSGEGVRIAASEFFGDFPPDARFDYRRERDRVPKRFIRAYRLRDPKSGKDGPWLAGMTLKAADVYEAWCHQRGYVCMIEEIGGRPVRPGQSFGAAFLVGFFDSIQSIQEMKRTYDRYAGHSALAVSRRGWRLLQDVPQGERANGGMEERKSGGGAKGRMDGGGGTPTRD